MTKSSFQNKPILPDFPLVEVLKDFQGGCLRKQKNPEWSGWRK